MFRRNNKDSSEQGSDRRRASNRGTSPNPAFSYYTSTRSGNNTVSERAQTRQQTGEVGKGGNLPRSFWARLPSWLLIALALVCTLKVLWLSSDPKVVVVGRTATSATYLQSSTVYAAAARKLLGGSPANHTKLTVDLGGTAQSLEATFPELQSVSIGLPLVSSRPVVYVQIAQPSLVLQTTHGNFALNKSGLVLAQLHAIPSQIPLVVDQSGATPHAGKQFLPGSTVGFVQVVAYQLAAAHLTSSAFVLPATSPYELDVRLSGQPYAIRFNLQADARTQSGAAIATIQQLGAAAPGQYLDVRVPDRVYYK
ncbi:MAG TPA: hypothetical protein VLE99_02200 [Candidatus Saccharimonadales bacterium]|nr:hypothetical protein [Candidatus Saccharimonadales bacterium]